mgnify:CR=1 FL=1
MSFRGIELKFIKKAISGGFLAAFLFCSSAKADVADPLVNYGTQSIERSEELFHQGLIRKAEYDLIEQIKEFPASPAHDKALILETRIDLISGNNNIALGKLNEFIERRSNSPFVPFAAFQRGLIAFEDEDFENAEKYMDEAASYAKYAYDQRGKVSYKRIAHRAYYWRGIALMQFGRHLDAVPVFEDCRIYFPEGKYADDALYATGRIYESTRDYKKAVDIYNEAVTDHPYSNIAIASHIRVANNYINLRQPAAALKSLNKAEFVLNAILNRDSLANRYEKQMFLEDSREYIIYLNGIANNLAGRNQEAYTYFSTVLGTFTDSEMINYVRLGAAWSLLNLSRYDESIELYDKVLSLEDADPNLKARARLYKAVAVKRNGNVKESREQLSALAMQSAYPYVAQALLELSQINYEKGEYQEARRNLERAERESVDAKTTVRIHLLLGAVYMEIKLWERAVSQYDKAESVAQKSETVNLPNKSWYLAESRFKKGIALVKSYRSAEAIKPLVTFIGNNKDDQRTAEALFWLAEAYYRSDLLNNAVETYSKIMQQYPATKRREQVLYGLGWSHFRQQQFRQATEYFDQMINEYPGSDYALEVLTRQGDGYYMRKQFSQASYFYERAAKKAPAVEEGQYAAYQLCHSLFRQGAYERAISASMDFIQKYPQSSYAPNTIYLIGWIRSQQNKYKEAIDNFKYLIKAYSRSILVPRAHYAIGDCHYNAGQYEKAMESYKVVVESFPSNSLAPEAFESIRYCLISLGREDEALKILDEYIEDNDTESPFVKDFRYKKGEMFYQGRNYQNAITEYEKYLEKYPESGKSAEVMFWKAKSYANLNENRKASETFNRVLKEHPNSEYAPLAILENGILHKEMAEINKADSIFIELQKIFPKHKAAAQGGFERAVMQFALGDTTESMNIFRDVANKYAGTDYGDQSRYRLAMYFRSKDLHDSARKHFRKLAKIDENPMIAAEAQYRIGELYMRDKEYNKAIEAFLTSIQKYSGYDDWYSLSLLNLGQAYTEIGDSENAKEIYNALIDWRKDDDFAKTAKARLRRL